MPGSRLNEQQISTELQISRPPLREAYRMLEHEKLVEKIPRKGTFATKMSPKNFEQIYEVREMIELYAIDLLAQKKITLLPEIENEMNQISNERFPDDYKNEDVKLSTLKRLALFHIKLIESSGNPYFDYCFRIIALNLARYQYFCFSLPGMDFKDLDDHIEMLSLIKKKYKETKIFLIEHFNYQRKLIREQLFSGK